jgi:tetratricopeptide (TPR) repeat protein
VTKRIIKSNVVFFSSPTATATSSVDKLRLAQQKVSEAMQASGKKRVALARMALTFSEDCADAYSLLAEESESNERRLQLFRKAVAAGEKTLGPDWQSKYKGIFWLEVDTRPLMRAMAKLAMELQEQGELSKALDLFRTLMQMNPNDNQGIRYLLAGCLYEAGCDNELEQLLEENKDDTSAAFLYTKAVYLFRKFGPSQEAAKALKKAFKGNCHVPIYLSDIVEMPDENPSTIGFGDESEAIAYVNNHCGLWYGTKGATTWLAETLGPTMLKTFEDRELVDDVLEVLKIEIR